MESSKTHLQILYSTFHIKSDCSMKFGFFLTSNSKQTSLTSKREKTGFILNFQGKTNVGNYIDLQSLWCESYMQ